MEIGSNSPARHCQFCEHQEVDFTQGTFCGLTGKRPKFRAICPDIRFVKKHETIIREVNLEHQKVKSSRLGIFTNAFGFLFASVSMLFAGLFLSDVIFDYGIIDEIVLVPVFLLLTSFMMFIAALTKVVNYRMKFKVVNEKKKELDELLSRYGITYAVDSQSKEGWQGKEHFASLKILTKHKH